MVDGKARKIIQDYVTYAKTLFENFGDKVKYWITLNEQNIFTSLWLVDSTASAWKI